MINNNKYKPKKSHITQIEIMINELIDNIMSDYYNDQQVSINLLEQAEHIKEYINE